MVGLLQRKRTKLGRLSEWTLWCCGIVVGIVAYRMGNIEPPERSLLEFVEALTLPQKLEFIGASRAQPWTSGNFSKYQWRIPGSRKEVSYKVIGKTQDDTFWFVANTGDRSFGKDVHIWRRLAQKDLRPGMEKRAILEVQGLFPFPLFNEPSPDLNLVETLLGTEQMVMPNGEALQVQHILFDVIVQGERVPFAEVWANDSIKPMGFWRARANSENMELMERVDDVPQESNHVREVLEQLPITTSLCSRCHSNSPGGDGVYATSPWELGGKNLVLPDALYHWVNGNLEFDNILELRVIEDDRDQRGLVVYEETVRHFLGNVAILWSGEKVRVESLGEGEVLLNLKNVR